MEGEKEENLNFADFKMHTSKVFAAGSCEI